MQCLSVEMKLRYLRERKEGGQGDARHLIRLEQELLNLASIKVLPSESMIPGFAVAQLAWTTVAPCTLHPKP